MRTTSPRGNTAKPTEFASGIEIRLSCTHWWTSLPWVCYVHQPFGIVVSVSRSKVAPSHMIPHLHFEGGGGRTKVNMKL